MMDYLKTDEEQGEALKRWLAQNGLGLVVAIGVGVGSVLGYQQWQQHQINQQSDAADRYQELIELSAINFADPETASDYERLLTVADGLRQSHAGSNYAALGAGIVAAQAVERGDFDLAVSQLTYAETELELPELKAMTSLRLARLELELGEGDSALSRVQSLSTEFFQGSRSELEGDILVALDQPLKAREAYLEAQASLTKAGLNTAVVDLKLSALPEGS
jgi:predicted negative regulator of RcsB-dependent stress response